MCWIALATSACRMVSEESVFQQARALYPRAYEPSLKCISLPPVKLLTALYSGGDIPGNQTCDLT